MASVTASRNWISAGLLSLVMIVMLCGCASTSTPFCAMTHRHPAVECNSSMTIKGEEKGVASWYGKRFHRKRTSSGERFNMYKLTAAHKTLPLSSYVLVTNLVNGKQVVVKVNDRGPFIRGRSLDLSYAAAKKIGMLKMGTAPVSIKPVAHA